MQKIPISINSRSKEFKIQCGEMPIVSGKVKPNSDKGELRFYTNEGLLFFEWRNLDKNYSNEPLVIFGNEWEWVKHQTAKGRVYRLQNKNFPDDKFFFWMQFPNLAEDEMNANIINNILNTGKLEVNENPGVSDEQSMENFVKKEEGGDVEMSNETQADKNKNLDFIKNFTSTLAKTKSKI